MNLFKKILFSFAILSFAALIFSSCQKDNDKLTGTIHLSITDAPIYEFDITGVFITITGIEYNHNGSWLVFEEFEGPQEFNLLDLTEGVSELLGSFELEAGTYTQIRFMLDAPVVGVGIPSTTGCWLKFEDGTTQPLFVPSGSQTGYKAVGEFTVPANGSVAVTADWNVEKSVVQAGLSGIFILKPVIRLVVDNQAGQIAGTLEKMEEGIEYVVYAYEADEYTEAEAADPAPETPRFPNAIVSGKANELGKFYLAFLAEGMYDLVIVALVDGKFSEVVGVYEDVEVISKKTTAITIDLTQFE